tara:strand:- start:174 stop:329 length:156 start_codon:yes stop_codon:yes gene_type:complete
MNEVEIIKRLKKIVKDEKEVETEWYGNSRAGYISTMLWDLEELIEEMEGQK